MSAHFQCPTMSAHFQMQDLSLDRKACLSREPSILFYPITLEGHRGTTDEFSTIPFHPELFSAALGSLAYQIKKTLTRKLKHAPTNDNNNTGSSAVALLYISTGELKRAKPNLNSQF